MINTKNVRKQFLKILSKTKNISDSGTRSEIMKELFHLRDYIKEEYNYDSELPTLTHNFVSDILSDIDIIDLAIKNYILSIGYELPKHEANEYGREQGRKHPNQDSSESVKIYRPNGLPERY